MSLAYLAKQNLFFQATPDYLRIGNAVFQPLDSDSGGYQKLDDRGYQVMLNYRSTNNIARQVTLTQVLSGWIAPEMIRGKVVLIGTTAPSAKDLFLTPYNLSSEKAPKPRGLSCMPRW